MVQHGDILTPSGAAAKLDLNGSNGTHANGDTIQHSPQGEADETFLREAVSQSGVNALRMALYQVTADPDLARMPVTKEMIRGGVLFDYKLCAADEEIVRRKAIEFLLRAGPKRVPSPPSVDEAHKLMNLFCGELIKEDRKSVV